jgi:TRAP-type mannitol/chloroaromatic compound transport system substrate-binding protein
MRALGDPANIIANMGAAVVTMFGGEIYESTQRGVIDTFEMGTFGANWGMGFQEVAPYVYIAGKYRKKWRPDRSLSIMALTFNHFPRQ